MLKGGQGDVSECHAELAEFRAHLDAWKKPKLEPVLDLRRRLLDDLAELQDDDAPTGSPLLFSPHVRTQFSRHAQIEKSAKFFVWEVMERRCI